MNIEALRKQYQREICRRILSSKKGIPNLADVSSHNSRTLAGSMVKKLENPLCRKPPSGQTVGMLFAEITMQFLNEAFSLLHHLRPGKWIFSASQAASGISSYDQYEHLAILDSALEKHRDLSALFVGEYTIRPDIVIGREPLTDPEINSTQEALGTGSVAKLTSLRRKNHRNPKSILHATVSCKWTIRSDRSQNTRTQALNLIRNRKGKTPHIVSFTAEPMPTRIASLAMGTGDIDCVYHMTLQELTSSAEEIRNEDQRDMLDLLVTGKRLRDISDLPFDLVL